MCSMNLNCKRRMQGGFTLPELVVAMALSTLIVVALQSSISLATRSVPRKNSVAQKDIAAARVFRQMETEVETCTRVLSLTSEEFTFLVPDRNGDGLGEKIRYAWPANPTIALTKTFNSEPTVTLLEGLTAFSITASSQPLTLKVNGPFTASAETTLAASPNPPNALSDLDFQKIVSSTVKVGQSLLPQSSGNEVVWRPTRLTMQLKSANSGSSVDVRLSPALQSGNPSSDRTSSDQMTIPASSMSSSYTNVPFLTPNAPWIKTGSRCTLVVSKSPAASSVTYAQKVYGQDFLYNSLSNWNRSTSASMAYVLYGQRGTISYTETINFPYIQSVNFNCETATGRTPVYAGSSLVNGIGDLSTDFNLNFDISPLLEDSDSDGVSDWQTYTGPTVPASAINGGKWTASSTSIYLKPACNFSNNTIIDLDWRSSQTSIGEAFCKLNTFRFGPSSCPLIIRLRKEEDGLQILTLENLATNPEKQMYVACGLNAGMLNTRLILSANSQCAILFINGVEHGTFALQNATVAETEPSIVVGSVDGVAEFDRVRARMWKR